MPCRVVTWNLWWRFGDWARRFEVIAAELAGLAPDVVGLQEVWATPTENAAMTTRVLCPTTAINSISGQHEMTQRPA